jgi:type III secretion protein U
MKDETEEKTLPASEKKLRDARRKGQVSHSKDLISGLGLVVAVLYLLHDWPTIRDRITGLVDFVSASADRPFAEVWRDAVAAALEVLLLASLPLAVIVFAAGVVAGMTGTQGLVFSFESIKPKIEHINPIEGAKRIFSLRNLIEFAKSLAKVAILTAVSWFVLRDFIQPLFDAPSCGETCLVPMLVSTLRPLAVTAAIVFLTVGLIDVLVQRRLFLRDMRMTRTERKREHKDLEGDPLVRNQRRQIRRQAVGGRVRTGLRRAVAVVAHGERGVGFRYNLEDAPTPIIVSKARGRSAVNMLAEARRLGIPIIDDAWLVERLIDRHGLGDTVRADLYTPMARIVIELGL